MDIIKLKGLSYFQGLFSTAFGYQDSKNRGYILPPVVSVQRSAQNVELHVHLKLSINDVSRPFDIHDGPLPPVTKCLPEMYVWSTQKAPIGFYIKRVHLQHSLPNEEDKEFMDFMPGAFWFQDLEPEFRSLLPSWRLEYRFQDSLCHGRKPGFPTSVIHISSDEQTLHYPRTYAAYEQARSRIVTDCRSQPIVPFAELIEGPSFSYYHGRPITEVHESPTGEERFLHRPLTCPERCTWERETFLNRRQKIEDEEAAKMAFIIQQDEKRKSARSEPLACIIQ